MVVVFSLLIACGPPPDAARAAWLQDAHVTYNRAWLERSPALVAQKFEGMADDPWAYMRGSAPVWYADLARPDPSRVPTRFLRSPEASDVMVVGDPHLENLGTMLHGAEPSTGDADAQAPLALEWIDLDAAGFGAWTMDLRRAAMTTSLLAHELGCEQALPGCSTRVAEALVDAYAQELRSTAGGAPWTPSDDDDNDVLAHRLRETARLDGLTGAAIAAVTTTTTEGRAFALDDDANTRDGLVALHAEERAQVSRLLAAWRAAPPALRVLDTARRYGKGVASLPAVRYLVLYDRGDDGPDDDRLIEVRELADPPRLAAAWRSDDDAAARMLRAMDLVWSGDDADPCADALLDGTLPFKVLTVTGWNQGFESDDVGAAMTTGIVEWVELERLATLTGRALGAAHARGSTGDGASSLEVILTDLDAGGGDTVLREEVVAYARRDVDTLYADLDLFRTLVDAYGPALGADALVGHAP